MSQNSTELLSINCQISISTDDEDCLYDAIKDIQELIIEFRTRVQVTTSTISFHDPRKFHNVFLLEDIKVRSVDEDPK